jgi:hypothetical protein
VRNRRRLARSGAREDAGGPADGRDCTPLLGVQLHPAIVRGRSAGDCDETVSLSAPGAVEPVVGEVSLQSSSVGNGEMWFDSRKASDAGVDWTATLVG